MKLFAPVYQLKRNARVLSRNDQIPRHIALDRIAAKEGYNGWSLLAARHATQSAPDTPLFSRLAAGDMVLVGARPGQGKTMLGIRLVAEAMKAGKQAAFFTLEYTRADVDERFRKTGVDPGDFPGLFHCDCSDTVNAATIIRSLETGLPGSLAIIDYLQLLDQRRENPALSEQLETLRSFTRERGIILVFLSQIDRSYDPLSSPFPGRDNIRMPNPVDLSLFDKMFFLNNGQLSV